MKNNEESLSSYGIRDGSKVILMATPAKVYYIYQVKEEEVVVVMIMYLS